jgi:hypothetical protein
LQKDPNGLEIKLVAPCYLVAPNLKKSSILVVCSL